MSKLSTAIRLIRTNRGVFLASVLENLNFLFPDKLYLQLLFRCKMGYWMDLENPKSFSEKLQWLKLYNRNTLYTTLVDKYAVKKWVADKIGEDHIIPMLGVWDNANDIDFEKLPNQFVLKTTNGGGGDVVICKDKSKFDKENAIKHLNQGLKKSIYSKLREWPYKNVSPRIIAEKYMEDENGQLKDYKFYCFNGRAQVCMVVSDRFGAGHYDSFDAETFQQLMFCAKSGKLPEISNEKPPENYRQMLTIANQLSEGFPHVRIDLYSVNNNIYFGEYTFFDGSGFEKYYPESWDYKFGDWLQLPSKRIQ